MCVCSTATTHTTINLPRPRQRLGSPDQTPKLTPIQHALGRIVVGVKGASFSCVADETFWRVCVMSSWVVWATQGHVLSASKLPSEKVGQQQGIIALSLPKPATFRARARKAVGEGERACVVLQNQNPEQTVTPASAERGGGGGLVIVVVRRRDCSTVLVKFDAPFRPSNRILHTTIFCFPLAAL